MSIFDLKNQEFKNLQVNLKNLKKNIERIEEKINNEGIEGYYSVNSEILEYAKNAYMSMRLLGYIKIFQRRNK